VKKNVQNYKKDSKKSGKVAFLQFQTNFTRNSKKNKAQHLIFKKANDLQAINKKRKINM